MASSRCLLLLVLHLLVFAAMAAAKMTAKPSLPFTYVSLEYYGDDKESIAKIAKFGYHAYKDAQNSRARKQFLPQLTGERWIAVGVKFIPTKLGMADRYCVIYEGLVFPPQFKLKAIVQIKFTTQLLTSDKIDQRSIRVDKIEYHPV